MRMWVSLELSQHRNFLFGFHTLKNLNANSTESAQCWASCVSNTHQWPFNWSFCSVVTWTPALLAARRIFWSECWLFWPYSFSISPSIQKMDCSHLEGRFGDSVIRQALTIFNFFFLLQLYIDCSWTPLRWGVVALPPLLLVNFLWSSPNLARHCFARLCARQCLPPSFIHHHRLSWKWHVSTRWIMPFAWDTPTVTELGIEWICAAGC